LNIPDPKDLKKLADACRKAGIKHFKQGDLEFTLSDEAPVSNYKKKSLPKNLPILSPILDDGSSSEELTQEQLLFYSIMDPTGESEESVQ
jgi:hypothetical protein